MENNKVTSWFSSRITQQFLLGFLTMACFGISLRNGFVWDDFIYIVNNPIYRDFNLRSIFFSLANGIEYLPVRDLTYVVDFLLWGNNPFGFHLTNLLFMIANVLLVHYLAELIINRCDKISGRSSSWFVPFAAAACFALHPLNAEAVNFIGCRNVLITGSFFFLATILMLKFFEKTGAVSRNIYLAAIFVFVCALLSKATAIVLPVLLSAVLPLLFPGQLKRIAVLLLPFYAVAFGFYVLFKKIADSVGLTNVNSSITNMSGKLALALQIPFFYLEKLFYPHGFSVEYETSFSDKLFSQDVLLASLLLSLLFAGVVYAKRRSPEISVGICWFIVALIPVLNFFSTHPMVADRYAYLPGFGFMLVLATIIDRLSQNRLKLLVFVPMALILAVISINRSFDWQSNETLWQANIRNFPSEPKSYLNLAAYYFKNGQQQKALDLLAANSNLPWLTLYLNLFQGKYFIEQNEPDKAREKFQQILNVVDDNVGALRCLGFLAEKDGDFFAAAKYYNKALSADQNDTFFERPFIRQRLKEIKRLWLDPYLSSLTGRLAQNPADKEVRRELALTLDQLGFYQESLEHYLALEKSGVNGWQLHHNIANCYFNLNRASKAVLSYEHAVALGDSSEEALNNMGVAYRSLGEYDKSINALQKARSLYPEAPYPLFNLGVTYFSAGSMKEARNIFAEVNRNFPSFRDMAAPFYQKLSAQPN